MDRDKKSFLIFPGWGTFEKMYDEYNVAGYEKIYIDTLDLDYIESILAKSKKTIILAWSMGTLLASKFIEKYDVEKAIFVAPTLNFTDSIHKIVVKKMIKDLKNNPNRTLKEFYKINFFKVRNYINFLKEYKEEISALEKSKLIE